MILILVLILTGAVGGALVYLGLRGRRIDDHPLCRKCGFDLTGRNTESDRCSECGAELSPAHAIVYGHRVRRRWLLNTGVILCLLASFIASASLIPAVRNFDPTPYKPTSWLIQNLNSSKTSLQQAALGELRRRINNNRLPLDAANDISNWVLNVQHDPLKQWNFDYGRLLEALREAKMLPDEQWNAYLKQGLAIDLEARLFARQGDPMPFQIKPAGHRLGDRQVRARYLWESFRIHGKEIKLPVQKDLTIGVSTGAASWSSPPVRLEESDTENLAPGVYEAVGNLRLEIWEGPASRSVNSNIPDTPPLAIEVRRLSTMFEIRPADADVKFAIVDEALREKLSRILHADVTFTPPDRLSVELHFAPPPVRLLGKAAIRINGEQSDLQTEIDIPANQNHSRGYGPNKRVDIGEATTVDILFIPEPERVRRSLDPTPTWGEEIVLKNVPIQRKEPVEK